MSGQKYFPNALESLGKTYYVAQNHLQTSDANPGTKTLPFKTISRAASVAGRYDTVIIGEGIYREQVPLLRHGHLFVPESLIMFKAAPGKRVYLKGSDIFNPRWQKMGNGVYQAILPEFLFKKGVYNPYELSCVVDEPGKVRPAKGPELPETLGQIYVDGKALMQLNSLHAVTDTPNSFIISSDGKEIICHFSDGKIPQNEIVELAVRERCFKPEFSGEVMIQTRGMVVEHAANPGAFSYGRPLTIRKNRKAGITVRKTFHARDITAECAVLRGNISYLSKNRPTLFTSLADFTKPGHPDKPPVLNVISNDGGKTWQKSPNKFLIPAYYYLDEINGMLLRYVRKLVKAIDHGDDVYGSDIYEDRLQVSQDEGKTWSKPERLDFGETVTFYQLLKLQNGRFLWPTTQNIIKPGYFAEAKMWLGTWRTDLSGVDWECAATIKVNPRISGQGLDEPHACQFPDGRIFAIFRQSPLLPGQDDPGFTSVKLFAVSKDNGQTWSEPKPLTYEDGKYVYSSTSYPDSICSSKNGRVYVIININDYQCGGCDPRTTLQIAEVDTATCCVKRDTIAIIEQKHAEHHDYVRFSNWTMLEDRYTKNLLLFTKLQMCEYCPVRYGYDFNSYRYEIIIPEK